MHILIGPRQCGKSTLFAAIAGSDYAQVTFDDFQMRNLADRDPALFLAQYPPPLVIDEIQYAPSIFPEIKRIIDNLKRERVLNDRSEEIEVLFYLTGSNQILLDQQVKETLVGRASYDYLNTFSVHEIKNAFPQIPLTEVLFKGGWPELYTNAALDPVKYLNDYIRNFIEKDIVVSAGIIKKKEFHTVLGMLAARTGNILNASSLAKDSGVKSVTINEWVSILERTALVYLLPPVEANLNKRLTKSPKVYFLDTGLATRLQGWMDIHPLLGSPQAGALFETLVLSEIVKFIMNFGKNWKVSLWRTKDGEEIDFIIDNGKGEILALDAKLSIHGAAPLPLPPVLSKTYPQLKYTILVTYNGKRLWLSKECLQIPLVELTDFLLETYS
ncbi:MAG: ATP-binding protein [Verrucomicrobia bacterium]|nr:ATP-binding protein [Verrucomicrobiota bacterium]